MPEVVTKLRDEVVESEKARIDLLKWKLVLVAGLGGAGLGIGNPAHDSDAAWDFDYLLCLIPLVAIYVDVLCAHLNRRIMVIAQYLRVVPLDEQNGKSYETFAERVRAMPPGTGPLIDRRGRIDAYAMEDWALQWSTVVLSILVILYGCVILALASRYSAALAFFFAGLFGLVLTGFMGSVYATRCAGIRSLVARDQPPAQP